METKFYLPVIKIVHTVIGNEFIHISEHTYENYEDGLEGLDMLIHNWSIHPHYKVIASEVQTITVSL